MMFLFFPSINSCDILLSHSFHSPMNQRFYCSNSNWYGVHFRTLMNKVCDWINSCAKSFIVNCDWVWMYNAQKELQRQDDVNFQLCW